MSERWQTDGLGRYCYIKARIGWRGLAASEYTDSGPFLIAGKHILSGRIDWDATDHISDFRYNESLEIALAEGDVILSKDGTIGRVARIDSLPGKATINGTMMLVRPVREIDYRFLYHVLNGAEFKKLIEDKVSGSSIPHIFQRDMVTLPVSFPPMTQQAKLAEVLDTLDTAIHETEAIIAKLKAVKQGLMHDLLTRGIDANGELRPPQAEAPHLYKESALGWIPKEWEIESVAKACSDVVDCPHSTPNFEDQGVLVARTMHIKDGLFLDGLASRVSERQYRERIARLEPQAGDVIFTREAPVGEAFVIPSAMKICLGQRVMLLRPKDRRMIGEYLLAQIYSGTVKDRIAALTSGTTNPHLNVAEVKDFEIPLPPFVEQQGIAERLRGLESRLQSEARDQQKLELLKSGLMDDLLTGRVRVTPLLDAAAAA